MSTLSAEMRPLAQGIQFTETEMVVSLADGRKLTIPLIWFPRLESATKSQLANFKILGNGEGIHWPELDEDLSVAGLLRGTHENT